MQPRITWRGKIALITGASSGIGEATARRLAAEGLVVLLTARRQERLEALAQEIQSAGGQAHIYPADLSLVEERQRLFERVNAEQPPVDVLVNNAGLGWYGYAADMPWQTAQQLLAVNVEAVVQLTLLWLPQMRARRQGRIINIGSVVGSIPSQGVAVYAATKAFVNAFTTAIYRELAGTAVKISVVRAGPIRTEFYESAAHRSDGLVIPVERLAISVERVAEAVWRVLRHPQRRVYVPVWLGITPWVEAAFGWIMDRIGPLLLKHQRAGADSSGRRQ